MSQLSVNAILDANGGNTATINSMTPTADSLQGFRNRIINGGMDISQSAAGASVTNDSAVVKFAVDRTNIYGAVSSKFTAQQNAGSVTPPAGFTNYLGCTSSSAYTVGAGENFWVQQRIEGYNVSDLGWGTANAKTVTLSFWVQSSLTGTFGGSFQNSASNRSYPFSYSISSANTWEYKTITVAGDTSGTWLTTNGIGLKVTWGIGVGSTFSGTAGVWAGANYNSVTGATSVVGTNGATFYITGVQLEVGSVATPFERRPFGTELALCQRYCLRWDSASGAYTRLCNGSVFATNSLTAYFNTPTQMRTAPTLESSSAANTFRVLLNGSSFTASAIAQSESSTQGVGLNITISGGTAGHGGWASANNTTSAFLVLTSEL
jgi:hypothetical protein